MTWAETCDKARSLGWEYGEIRTGWSTWFKVVDGKRHIFGKELWKAEVENGA